MKPLEFWRDDVSPACLTLHVDASVQITDAPDIPGAVLRHLPAGTRRLHHVPERLVQAWTEGDDQVLDRRLSTDGRAWSCLRGGEGVTMVAGDSQGRAVVIVTRADAGSDLYTVGPASAPLVRPLIGLDVAVSTAVHLDDDRVALGLSERRIAVVNRSASGEVVLEGCWRLPAHPDVTGDLLEMRAMGDGTVLWVSEQYLPDEGEGSVIFALNVGDERPRLVAQWSPTPGSEEDDFGRYMTLTLMTVGPFKGRGADPSRVQTSPFPEAQLEADVQRVIVEGLEAVGESTGPALEVAPAPTRVGEPDSLTVG